MWLRTSCCDLSQRCPCHSSAYSCPPAAANLLHRNHCRHVTCLISYMYLSLLPRPQASAKQAQAFAECARVLRAHGRRQPAIRTTAGETLAGGV